MKNDATTRRTVRLFRNGASQAVRIPKEFEFAGEEIVLVRDGDRIILEPVRSGGLLDTLRTLGGWDEPFPDVDEGLGPLDDVDL